MIVPPIKPGQLFVIEMTIGHKDTFTLLEELIPDIQKMVVAKGGEYITGELLLYTPAEPTKATVYEGVCK